MKSIRKTFLFISILSCFPAFTQAWAGDTPPTVVASIAPLHSLVAGIMDGVVSPHLLMDAHASPHTWYLKPSDMRALGKADLVVWVGPGLETALAKPLAALDTNKTGIYEMDASQSVIKLPYSEEDESDHDHAHSSGIDPHMWLDPLNAISLVQDISARLQVLDPVNKEKYRQNTIHLIERLKQLDSRVMAQMKPFRDRPFMVFHDGYQYFIHRYELSFQGSITLNPAIPPGARRMAEVREKLVQGKAVCLLAEPQFSQDTITTIASGTSAKVGIADPLGSVFQPGPELYFQTIERLADNLETCLSP